MSKKKIEEKAWNLRSSYDVVQQSVMEAVLKGWGIEKLRRVIERRSRSHQPEDVKVRPLTIGQVRSWFAKIQKDYGVSFSLKVRERSRKSASEVREETLKDKSIINKMKALDGMNANDTDTFKKKQSQVSHLFEKNKDNMKKK